MNKALRKWNFGSHFRLEMDRDYGGKRGQKRIYRLYTGGYGWPEHYAVGGYSVRQVLRRLRSDLRVMRRVNRRIEWHAQAKSTSWNGAFAALYGSTWPAMWGLGSLSEKAGRVESCPPTHEDARLREANDA